MEHIDSIWISLVGFDSYLSRMMKNYHVRLLRGMNRQQFTYPNNKKT